MRDDHNLVDNSNLGRWWMGALDITEKVAKLRAEIAELEAGMVEVSEIIEEEIL
jgi:hypothetical protein